MLASSNNADRPALVNQMTLPNGRKLYFLILASHENKSTSFLCIKSVQGRTLYKQKPRAVFKLGGGAGSTFQGVP
jgi:hypothetical protein